MMMKYFRFLYGETGRCFMHLGEIRDTKTEEHFTFLYLRGVKRHVNQTETEHTLFLCPKRLDLVVLGNSDEYSVEVLREFLADTAVDTLVYCANTHFAIPEIIPGVRKVVCLTDERREDNNEVKNCQMETKEVGSGLQSYYMERAGWKFAVRCCGNVSLMLTHGLASCDSDADRIMTSGGAVTDGMYPYKDCVMSVKIVSEDKRCCSEQEPDGFGCALGCSLHQDYDVCNYQRKNGRAYVTGTVLLPEGCGSSVLKALIREQEGEFPEIRFVGLPGTIGPDELKAIVESVAQPVFTSDDMKLSEKSDPDDENLSEKSASDAENLVENSEVFTYKRYFIGVGSELRDETIAAVSKSSMYHVPLMLEPGNALCCSGMLKYPE